jgi:hypothetical protein
VSASRTNHDADADGAEDVAALQRERLRDDRQQAIGDGQGVLRRAHAVEQDREFVAAQPRQRVLALDA